MDIKEDQLQWYINFFDKKSQGSGLTNNNKENIQLVDELHKPIIRKFKKENCILHLEIIFGVQIQQICNY